MEAGTGLRAHPVHHNKLIRTGVETYIARLYRQGELTLREAASRLGVDVVATLDILLDHGIKGNLDADDVLTSIRHFS